MKKVIISLACAALALNASAQRAVSSTSSFFSTEKVAQPVTIGIRAGGNLSTFTGDGTDDLKSKFGYNVGVNVDFSIVESFGVQTGVFFTTKGAKSEVSIEDSYGIETYKATSNPMYIQVPILASYRYNINDNLRWEFNVGPYFAFGVGGKITETEEYYDYKDSDEQEIEEEKSDFFGDKTNTFDMGMILGTGLTINKFYVGLQWELGMTHIYDYTNDKTKNSNLSLNVGYNF